MLILEAGEVCPYANRCPHNNCVVNPNSCCFGALKDRKTQFTCEFVKDGKIAENKTRIPGDQTGKMRVLME